MDIKAYNEFWNKEINKSVDGFKRPGWFRRLRYRNLAYLLPAFFLKRYPAKKYYKGATRLAEGVFCDLGCGLGNVTALYSVRSGNYAVGLDISSAALRFALKEKQRLRLAIPDYLVAGIAHTPFHDNTFDSVYLGQVLEHIKDENKILNEAVRITKPGGQLIISVPDGNKLPSPDHIRTYNRQSLELLLGPDSRNWLSFYYFDAARIMVSLRVSKAPHFLGGVFWR